MGPMPARRDHGLNQEHSCSGKRLGWLGLGDGASRRAVCGRAGCADAGADTRETRDGRRRRMGALVISLGRASSTPSLYDELP